MDQVRAVGRVTEGFQSRAFSLGACTRGGLPESYFMAEIRGGGDEKQVYKSCQERVGPGGHPSPQG